MGDTPTFRLAVPNSINADNLAYTPVGSHHTAALAHGTTSLPEHLREFLGAHHGPSTDALLSALPEGDYFIVKSPRAATRPRFLCVGNDSVPAGESVLCLVDTESPPDAEGREFRFKAYILGSDPTSPPCLQRPMLGMTITRMDGSHASFGLLFLPMGERNPLAPSDELLLVVPRRGELVIDVKARFAERFPDAYPDEWWTGHDKLAARLLATSS